MNIEQQRALALAAARRRAAEAQQAQTSQGPAQDQLDSEIRRMLGFGQSPEAPVDLNTLQQTADFNAMNGIPLIGPALGAFGNTLRAATAGAQDTAMLNMSDELWGVTAGVPQALANGVQGKGWNLDPVAAEYAASSATRERNRTLNPTAYDVGSVAGMFALGGKAKTAPPKASLPSPIRTGATAATYGGIAGFGSGETTEERLTNAATGAATAGTLGYGAGRFLAPKARTPTVKQLFDAGDAQMAKVAASGAVVSQPAATNYVTKLRGMLRKEGLITPGGKVANYPSVSHALSLAEDFATGNMTMANAKALRTALGDVAGAVTKAERRVGVKMIKQLDDFMENLKPSDFISGNGKSAVEAWRQARAIYHTAFKGEAVEKLISTATRKSKKATAVPLEQSLRNQFDSFVGNDKKMRGFTPAERAQMSRVGDGTAIGNTAKTVGRLAPTTLAGLPIKGGAQYLAAEAIAPGSGVAVATGLTGLGYIGRFISKLSTKHQAELARVLVLNGGKLPSKIPPGVSPEVARVIGNIMLTTGAGSAEVGRKMLDLLQGNQSPHTQQRPAA